MTGPVVQPPIAETGTADGGEGLKKYYTSKNEELQLTVAEKNQNLRRLQAQRNELNAKVRMLREELQLLQEQGSYVGEVVKAMDKKNVIDGFAENLRLRTVYMSALKAFFLSFYGKVAINIPNYLLIRKFST